MNSINTFIKKELNILEKIRFYLFDNCNFSLRIVKIAKSTLTSTGGGGITNVLSQYFDYSKSILKKRGRRIYRTDKDIAKSYGALNPQEVYYVIHRSDLYAGLFSLVIGFLADIDYAVKNKYVPIIDLKNYHNAYLYPEELGLINSWEYYFEQPIATIYNLDTIYQSKNVISNNGIPRSIEDNWLSASFILNRFFIRKWSEKYKKYIRINAKTMEHINRTYNSIVLPQDNVLGVFCRGTDYVKYQLAGHPVQPEVDRVIEDARNKMKKWNCNKIFLTTEDYSIFLKFKSEFKDSLITTKRKYANEITDLVTYNTTKTTVQSNSKYLSGLEYLTEMVILSKCNYIIAGVTSGTVAVSLMTKRFNDKQIYDLGHYPNSKQSENFFKQVSETENQARIKV